MHEICVVCTPINCVSFFFVCMHSSDGGCMHAIDQRRSVRYYSLVAWVDSSHHVKCSLHVITQPQGHLYRRAWVIPGHSSKAMIDGIHAWIHHYYKSSCFCTQFVTAMFRHRLPADRYGATFFLMLFLLASSSGSLCHAAKVNSPPPPRPPSIMQSPSGTAAVLYIWFILHGCYNGSNPNRYFHGYVFGFITCLWIGSLLSKLLLMYNDAWDFNLLNQQSC